MTRIETRARARALQLLYAWDLLERPPLAGVIARVAVLTGPRPELDRAAELATLAAAAAADADARIAEAVLHWRFERVGAIERNILRLALAELAEGVTPARVVISEAVQLAQWFAGARAPAFINGVLDALARAAGKL